MPKTVLILSGGMDSTTLLYYLINRGNEIIALSFDYGQRHKKEIDKAAISCKKLNIPHHIIPFTKDLCSLIANSALTDHSTEVPVGHYADENMKATVVPNRNMIMLSLAAGFAISIGAKELAYAAHAGDHAIYPDCRPEFVEAMVASFRLCHFDGGIQLKAPFLNINKNDICVIGTDLGVPYEDTWTCYVGGEKPCGTCGACVERAEAFAYANRTDPLLEGE